MVRMGTIHQWRLAGGYGDHRLRGCESRQRRQTGKRRRLDVGALANWGIAINQLGKRTIKVEHGWTVRWLTRSSSWSMVVGKQMVSQRQQGGQLAERSSRWLSTAWVFANFNRKSAWVASKSQSGKPLISSGFAGKFSFRFDLGFDSIKKVLEVSLVSQAAAILSPLVLCCPVISVDLHCVPAVWVLASSGAADSHHPQ